MNKMVSTNNNNNNKNNKEEFEQASKQNRWGSLAARLELQCEDVLSMEAAELGSNDPMEEPPSRASTDGRPSPSISTPCMSDELLPPAPDRLEREISIHSATGSASGSSANLSSRVSQRQLELQQHELSQSTAHGARRQEFQAQPSPAGVSKTTTTSTALKDWIVKKKIDKEIKEATTLLPSSGSITMTPFEKQHVQKCVKIAYLLVAHLAKSFEGSSKTKSPGETSDSFDVAEDWEPKPQDIDEESITVTEDALTGDIIDVGFDVLRNFDWDQNPDQDTDATLSHKEKLGNIFEALGKLLFKLFMQGEDVPPCPTSTDAPLYSNSCADGEGTGIIPNEYDILNMLRNLPAMGATAENGENDYIASAMSNRNLPKPLCRLVADIFYTSSSVESNGDSANKDDDAGHCFGSLSDVHSDIQQMVDFPDAFLFGTVNSRWELVFGNNHMFGRKNELQQLMDAAYRIQNISKNPGSTMEMNVFPSQRKKEVVMVNGHAGCGKSRLVREMRRSLQAQGWIFLRCKFGKSIQSEPLSVIALGLDEYFSTSFACSSAAGASQEALGSIPVFNDRCSCVNPTCPKKICERLETLIGLDGLKCLSQQMPSLCSLVWGMYANGGQSLDMVNGGLQGKFHTHHLFGTLLDTLATFAPVSFFVDDLQWADAASLELLTGLINRVVTNFDGNCSSTNKILFVGAYRTDNVLEEVKLKNMIQEFEASDTINTTEVTLLGFHLESLNEMVSEALCLPRRKTKSLSQIIYDKTQGFPLFVVEFLDALWTEKLLIHNPADGWEWDVDAIDLKEISKSVAELLACKLKKLPVDVLSGVQVLSCFGSHVDIEVLEAAKNYEGNSGTSLMPALDLVVKEGLVERAGPTFTFSHDLIQKAAFDLVPAGNRIPLLQKLVSCLIPCCMLEGGADSFLFVTVDLINRIGSDAVLNDPTQSQLFAQLNLDAGKKFMALGNFSSATEHFKSGISFLKTNHWKDQYELSLNLFENSALAYYSEGNHEQVVIQANHVLSNGKSFEDKFKSDCIFINVIAIGSMDRAAEMLYDRLRQLGENIDPTMIGPQLAFSECVSTRELLSGGQKNIFLQLPQMSDRTKLMEMRLMAMLVQYYTRQKSFMSGYFLCKMIRISLQHGHCEDAVFALAAFSPLIIRCFSDVDGGYSLARTAISMMKFYNSNQLIPRIYWSIYGTVFVLKDPIQSLIDPLLNACRLSFTNGNFEFATINTIQYISRSLQAGKKIPLVMNELNAFANQYKLQSHMSILRLFLAPMYRWLSSLSGISLDSNELLAQLAASSDDVIEVAKVKNEFVLREMAIRLSLVEAVFSRNFRQAAQVLLNYPDIFKALFGEQVGMNEFVLFPSIYVGLVLFQMARETREPQWLQNGINVLATFENRSSLNAWNFEWAYLLLKAELHYTKGETNAAVQAYDLSVESAQKSRLIPKVAIACEYAAHYFLNIGAKKRAQEMIQRSHNAFMEWGAGRKAAAINNLMDLK